jgi:hypothetical protein
VRLAGQTQAVEKSKWSCEIMSKQKLQLSKEESIEVRPLNCSQSKANQIPPQQLNYDDDELSTIELLCQS